MLVLINAGPVGRSSGSDGANAAGCGPCSHLGGCR